MDFSQLVLQLAGWIVIAVITVVVVNVSAMRMLKKNLEDAEKKLDAKDKAHAEAMDTMKKNHANEMVQKDNQIQASLNHAEKARKDGTRLYNMLKDEREEHDNEVRDMTNKFTIVENELRRVAKEAKEAKDLVNELKQDLDKERIYRERVEEQRNKANELLGIEREARELAEKAHASAEKALKDAEERYEKLVNQLRQKLKSSDDERSNLAQRLEQAEKDRDELRQRINQLEESHEQNQDLNPVPDGAGDAITDGSDGAG